MPMDYCVSIWLTHPDLGNDDCMTSEDFATEVEARAAIADPDAYCGVAHSDCAFIEIDGPDCHEVVERPGVAARARREARRAAQDAKNEAAMQAGMGLGVEAYNDMMGW